MIVQHSLYTPLKSTVNATETRHKSSSAAGVVYAVALVNPALPAKILWLGATAVAAASGDNDPPIRPECNDLVTMYNSLPSVAEQALVEPLDYKSN